MRGGEWLNVVNFVEAFPTHIRDPFLERVSEIQVVMTSQNCVNRP